MSIEAAFLGVLGREAEAKTSKTGKPYLRLSVRVGDGDSAQWVSVICFDASALEAASQFVAGARVYSEGKLSLDEWTAQDGIKRQGLSMLSFHCRLAQIGRNKPAKSYPRKVSQKPSKPIEPAGQASFDDEIPFAPEVR